MKHLRLIIIIAGGAFLLAMLTGIFNGIGFGKVLFRSLLTAVLFGGLAYGLIFTVDKFLPELSGQSESGKESEAEDELDGLLDNDEDMPAAKQPESNNVDIVLEDENPYSITEEGDQAPQSPDSEPEEDTARLEDADSEEPEQDQGTGTDFVEEIGSEESEGSDESDIAAAAVPGSSGDDVEDIGEDLPSLDQFSSTFNSMESSFLETEGSGDVQVSSAGSDKVEVMGDEHSPGELAKAVQTLLSKDEKG